MWYLIRSVFKCIIVEDSNFKGSFEEKVIIAKHKSIDLSKNDAEVYLKSHEHSYENEQGETVSWVLFDVRDIEEIGESLECNFEVYGKIYQDIRDIDE
jgi:hypothetical protein